jgi:hypothetical protein
LGGADLGGANLRGAYLEGAYLVGANLGEADLVGAKLGGAKLGEAYLREADLSGADLREADLVGANLVGANLVGANLEGVLGGPYSTSNRVLIKFPDQIQIDGESHTVEEWDQVITQRKFSRLTIALYESYRVFLRLTTETPTKGVSRFERIS